MALGADTQTHEPKSFQETRQALACGQLTQLIEHTPNINSVSTAVTENICTNKG